MMRKKHVTLAIPKIEGWNFTIEPQGNVTKIVFSTYAGSATIMLPTPEANILGTMIEQFTHPPFTKES